MTDNRLVNDVPMHHPEAQHFVLHTRQKPVPEIASSGNSTGAVVGPGEVNGAASSYLEVRFCMFTILPYIHKYGTLLAIETRCMGLAIVATL
jgi:hypothetical protein